MQDYHIDLISNVKKEDLHEFYNISFQDRNKILINNWKWIYRSGYLNYEPILLLNNKKKIIGQAALIPAKISYKDIIYPSVWFVDFVILKEFRGKGLGEYLTKQWMKICPNQITYCNDSSLKIFKKLGWQDSKTSKRIALPVNYLKFIPIIKKYNFTVLEKFFLRKKENKLNTIPLISPKLLIEDKNKIINFFSRKKIISSDNLQILRDEDWFVWRFFDCPYNKNIYYFEYENNFTIVHIFKTNNIKRLNILYFFCTDYSKEDYLFLIIYKWALTNSIDLLWANSNDQNFINKLKEFFKVISVKPLLFASYSSDELINKTLKNGINNICAADSDNDIFQINNSY
jgi:hypothetical protein